MRGLKIKLILGAILLVLCRSIAASAQTVTGDIGGVIADNSGAVIVGAQVTATNVATTIVSSTVTNKDGVYSIRFLPIGTYKVTISAKGFGTQSFDPFLLEVAQVAEVNAK